MKVRLFIPNIIVLLVVSSAHATPLSPGSQVVPSAEAALPAGSYAFSPTTLPITGINALGQTRFTGTLTFAVYRESATGFLDFLYQYHANTGSRDPIEHFAMTDFSGFSTNVTHITATAPSGFVLGTIAPGTASRSPDGGVVAFNFLPHTIPSGNTSQVEVIHTNATLMVPGTTNVIDGAIATVVTRGPRGAPEPATLTLFGGGLLSLGAFVWKRRHAKIA